MAYQDHFRLVDDVSVHFDGTVGGIDAFLLSRYVGFYAVASAAVIELALKEIVISFAKHNHPLFGTYIEDRYDQINGRIKIGHITQDHLRPFGDNYVKRFERLLKRVDDHCIRSKRFSVKGSYGSLIACRHDFAHAGTIPANAGYADIKTGFEAGKIVLACLAKTLKHK